MNRMIYAAECLTCTPWVRLWKNPATGLHVRQVLHEDTCKTYPKFSRSDLNALSGD